MNIGLAGVWTQLKTPGAHYVSYKAGLSGLTRCITEEGSRRGITPNYVTPGPVRTSLTASSSPQAIASLTAGAPIGRCRTAEEITAVVEVLASEDASFIVEAVLDANSGSAMA